LNQTATIAAFHGIPSWPLQPGIAPLGAGQQGGLFFEAQRRAECQGQGKKDDALLLQSPAADIGLPVKKGRDGSAFDQRRKELYLNTTPSEANAPQSIKLPKPNVQQSIGSNRPKPGGA